MTDATSDDPPDRKLRAAGRQPARTRRRHPVGPGSHFDRTGRSTLFRQMVRTRALEERAIKMSKSGEAFFWTGGPGEEAFNVCLGLQIKKGRGPAFDYLHLHYRNSGVMVGMGMPMLEHVRQLAMTATDRHSRGRNFVGHYAMPEWNVVPVTSVIEKMQMVMAPGTALGAEAARRGRAEHRRQRRRRHRRGGFRKLPLVEQPAGQRAAGADPGDEQRLGHQHPAREFQHADRRIDTPTGPTPTASATRPIDGNDLGGLLARHRPGHAVRPPGAEAVRRCRGAGEPLAARPLVVQRALSGSTTI